MTFATSVPRNAQSVWITLAVEKSSCNACGEAAKVLRSAIQFYDNGKRVEFNGKPRTTLDPCPACGAITSEEKAPVRPPRTPDVVAKSGVNVEISDDARLLRAMEEL